MKITIFKTSFWKIFTSSLICWSFFSCESYLDVDKYIYDKTTIDSVFVRKEKFLEYLNSAIEELPYEDRLFTNSPFPFALGGNECFASWEDNRHAAMFLLLDDEQPLSPHFNNWGQFYRGIRKVNLMLQRIGECKEFTDIERRDYIGQLYFLRAYFYYSLLRQYGPFPILPDEPMSSDEQAETAAKERDTYDDCVEYICNNLEQAAELLTLQREQVFRLRPTVGAALAVLSRIRLHAASPWYNGNTRYADWTRSDGRHFISQQADPQKWALAAVAAKRVINLNKYQINTVAKKYNTPELPSNVSSADFPNGAGNIDPYLSYSSIFNGYTPSEVNEELIYYYNNSKYDWDSPAWIAFPAFLGGGGGLNVTQEMIDAYRMRDGKTISEAQAVGEYPTVDKEGDPINQGYSFSELYEVSPNMAKMHDNREARFYASIGFNHCIWPGTSYMGADATLMHVDVSYYVNSTTGGPPANLQNDFNRTGYTCRKYVHPEDNFKELGYLKQKVMPIFRYAEILLNYVEAMNEMGNNTYTDPATEITVSRNTEEMKKYFNMIRFRAGLPGITDEEASSYEKIKELIKLERKVEFAFEGFSYHDLRRWGDAYSAYNKKIDGLNVKARTTERASFYIRTILDSESIVKRVFSNKMYFFPIPQESLNKNAKLVQNPGW